VQRGHALAQAAAGRRAGRIAQRGRRPRRCAALGGQGGPRQGLRQLRAAPPDP
jgi:hypothetical protein